MIAFKDVTSYAYGIFRCVALYLWPYGM